MLQNLQFKYSNHIKCQSRSYRQFIWTAQISEDENFLAIGMANQIQTFYLKNKKLIKNIRLDRDVSTIKFSKDSKILYSGDDIGKLYCFDLPNNFKLIYKDRVNQNGITDMISIDSDQILTCSKESIKITNIKEKQQQSMIRISDQNIFAVEYDQSRDQIVYSEQGEIFFSDRKDSKIQIICSNENSYIVQLQLQSNSSNLLGSSYDYLNLWQIDYENRSLIMIKQFLWRITNFTSILNNSKLVLICEEYIQIIDNEFVIIHQINHNLKNISRNQFKTRQLNSLKYIIVLGGAHLKVLKRR